ncbi:hypothetical protein [Actinoplanes subglobosus]|uniref:Uncharacterized protein n=1 Tax=Actinoplanes subglobosus TaxID=1547892 RepID=A0ABV8J2U3_9ACTN
MGYLFLVHHDVARSVLAAALAELLSLPVTAVDVGDIDQVDRDWGRSISCTVTPMTGDLRLHLDMWFAAGTVSPPEEEAAAWLAARLGTLIAYQSVTSRPSAYWLVGPDGHRTRARLDSGGDFDEQERTVTWITAVEAPVGLLPTVPVTAIPEVIHEYRMPTPLSDALTGTGPRPDRLAAWEALVARLTAGWCPDGWYPPGSYREALELRDDLAGTEFTSALEMIDRRFIDATVNDGGAALAQATGPVPDRWWWRRVTDPLPWRRMPGGPG